jgi:peptide/nickel transport system substrate-binding protein
VTGARIFSTVAVAMATLCLAACGGDSSSSSGSHEDKTLQASYNALPDYLDPGLSFTLEGWTAMWNSYIPLLTYTHASGPAGSELIPGLAEDLPKISDDGRTYTMSLRKGLKYSDGTPVRASDFTHTIERDFKINSPGSGFYTDIVGAEKFAETRKGGIPGIETDDRSGEIVIHLLEPRGTFSNELAMLFAAPLPPDTPAEDLSHHPPPATGPYEITNLKPARGWDFVRNPEWAQNNAELLPQLPSGHVDRIEVSLIRNPSTQVDDVERGRSDWMQNPPPPDRYAEVRRKFEGTQFRAEPQINLYYFWMNTTTPPFDDVEVRRAVNYAVDPAALERIFAGQLKGLQQILPPAMPGHRDFDLYPHDLAKAKAMVRRADPSDRQVTVWTDDFGPNKEAGEYYEGVLRQIGLEPKLKVLPGENYFTVIGNLSTPDLDTGFTNWLEDYPHPSDFFSNQLTPAAITPTRNANWAQFDDPALNPKIERLAREQLGPKQEDEYAELDEEVMEQAPWAPFGTLTFSTFVSSAVDLDKVIYSPIMGTDLTSFEFK